MKKGFLLLMCCFVFGPLAAGNHSNPLVFGNNRITLITDGLVRLEYAVDGKFFDDPTMFAYDRSHLLDTFSVEKLDGNRYRIETGRMTITYTADGFPFGAMNFRIEFDNGGEKPSRWTVRQSAFPSKNNLCGAIATLDNIDGRTELDEGLLSRDGYYMIDDTGKERLVDGWIAEPSKAHVQDYYVFIYGTDYRSALRSLGAISGRAPMNRKYMHGAWYCRFYNYSADDYRRIVREYREHDFPLDVLVFDMDWHTMDAKVGSGHGGRLSWTGYTWNRKQFPDPAGLLAEFRKEHIYVPLNDHPADGIRPHEEGYDGFMRAMGEDPAEGRSLLFDAGDRKYMENFFRYALEPNEKIGAAFWWLDWQQNYIQPWVRGTRMRHLPWLNHLYYRHSLKGGLRGALYSRWGGWGTQRYPIQFSGDTYASWEMIAFQVEMTATSGNAGCFFWAHDLGGHYNGDDPEMYARWTQFGAVSSSLRVHSSSSAPDRRPWNEVWGRQATESMRRAYHFRSEMMPYIYSSLWQVHREMVPLTRALYIDYPRVEEAYRNPQEYLLGDLVLTAPIASPGKGPDRVAEQTVWFPVGDSWYDLFTGRRFEGGTKHTVSAPLNEFPVYVKGGYPLPMQPYTPRMATARIDTLIVRCYPGGPGADNGYELYEDDGLSLDYTRGRYALTPLRYRLSDGGLTVTVGAAEGEYEGQPAERSYRIELPGLSSCAVARIDGRRTKIAVNDRGMPCIDVPRRSIRRPVEITLTDPYQ